MNQSEFITKFCEILGDDFFLSDMIFQEELFEKQDALAQLICKAANENLLIAKQMTKGFSNTFKISTK
jgi:hypothetical protein